jgi:jumonji domain-containing protein 7
VLPGEEVKVLEDPSPLDFMRALREYKPCLLRGVIDKWEAFKWENALDEIQKLSPEYVPVNFTPKGNADSVEFVPDRNEYCFVYPAEISVPFQTLREMLQTREGGDAVPYLSQQDDNLRKLFPDLLKEIEPSLPIADEAFGCDKLEAINLWIGDERSVTSLHKDFYENMYAVIEGEKVFHLYPPSDTAYLPERKYPPCQYQLHSRDKSTPGRVKTSDLDLLSRNEDSVAWIALDPMNKSVYEQYPCFSHATALVVSVHAGEVLYLPALWYHRVTQTQMTIAVNYWYDMDFDFRFVFYEAIRDRKKELNIK